MLTREELTRYSRQIMIEGFGEEGQARLKEAKVVVAGAGGLGSPIALYLAAAGIGTIRVIDKDKVELSNLNRQILHWDENIGQRKTSSAGDKLRRINKDVKIEAIAESIADNNVSQLTDGFDLIVDAMDNLPTRLLLNKTAVGKNIPFFHGAVSGFEGRAMTVIPRQTACLKCLYPGDIPAQKTPVIGVTPAIIGCIQATEVIKYITGIGHLLTNRLLFYNGLEMVFDEIEVKRNPNCQHCGTD